MKLEQLLAEKDTPVFCKACGKKMTNLSNVPKLFCSQACQSKAYHQKPEVKAKKKAR